MLLRKGIEVVITALTRNQVCGNASWVRIPLFPPKQKDTFAGVLLFWQKDVGMKYAATCCRRSSICGSKYLPRYSVLQGLNLLQKHVNGNGNIPLF